MASSSNPVSEDRYKYIYRMDRPSRGTFIIINNKKFEKLPKRVGTNRDAANLHQLFKRLGFTVRLHRNKTAEEMFKLMNNAAKESHDHEDCFGVAILSHGREGFLYGVDVEISIEELVTPFKSCVSLSGKPKLFFFQACRGEEVDTGQPVADADGPDDECKQLSRRIPREADFLFSYSTTPGHVSWTNTQRGSWYVDALYKVLSDETLRRTLDLGRLLTRVNHYVAYEFESKTSDVAWNARHMFHKKQMPCVLTMLTKDLYFP